MKVEEFLRARLDEVEAKIKHALRMEQYRSWWASDEHEEAAKRALRDVEAKRRILALLDDDTEDGGYADGWYEGIFRSVIALAGVFSDHPDFQPEWSTW